MGPLMPRQLPPTAEFHPDTTEEQLDAFLAAMVDEAERQVLERKQKRLAARRAAALKGWVTRKRMATP